MTKRVTIEIPEKMYFLLSKFGGLHDMDADDYATMALGRHLAQAIEKPTRWRKCEAFLSLGNHRTTSDYRIICDIQDGKLIVLVVEIGHRSSVYR